MASLASIERKLKKAAGLDKKVWKTGTVAGQRLHKDTGLWVDEKYWAGGLLEVELHLARWGDVGFGRAEHIRRAAKEMWPKRCFHAWTERRFKGLAKYDFLSWTGCGGSGKTDDAAMYAIVWWLVDPMHSTVVMTSTTGKMIRRRMWPAIQRLYYDNVLKDMGATLPAELLETDMCMRLTVENGKRDNKSAIFAKPVKDGSVTKAAADIQGMHNKRVLVIVDEAPETPPAIFTAIANLRIGCEEFKCIVIGNPESRLDEHGKFSEPKDGWGSIDDDCDEWETVPQLNGFPGLCQVFDGEMCPNVLNPDPRYGYLLSRKDLEGVKASKGGSNTPEFWKYYRGRWAPEGICNTVMSELEIIRHQGTMTYTFGRHKRTVAGLDPGFGGDKCKLQFGVEGDAVEANGKIALQLTDEIVIYTDARSKDPMDYQIAYRVIAECKQRNVEPDDLGIDATGIGRGVYAIVCKEWSTRVKRVEFGGRPSDMPAGPDDPRPAKEVYDRRVTEVCFSIKWLLRSGLLRGIPISVMRDLTTRQYTTLKGSHGVVYSVEKKEEMKERINRSPDDGDAAAVLLDAQRQRGIFVAGEPAGFVEDGAWDAMVKETNALYERVDYLEN